MTQSFHNGPIEMAPLTAEQQEHIRFNKERALAKRGASLQKENLLQPPQPASSLWNLPNPARASIPNGVGSGVTGRNQHLPLTLTLPLPSPLPLTLTPTLTPYPYPYPYPYPDRLSPIWKGHQDSSRDSYSTHRVRAGVVGQGISDS